MEVEPTIRTHEQTPKKQGVVQSHEFNRKQVDLDNVSNEREDTMYSTPDTTATSGSELSDEGRYNLPGSQRKNTSPSLEQTEIVHPPPAREAAFSGPPRYDWIDVETAAAIKVQAVIRRNITMSEMEKQGLTTAAIRNRSRDLKRRKRRAAWETLFGLCGVDLVCQDAFDESIDIAREERKAQYETYKREKEAQEEELREKYRKNVWSNKNAVEEESYEIVQ